MPDNITYEDLRLYYAGQAMPALLALIANMRRDVPHTETAAIAFAIADAMVAEAMKEPEK